MNADQRDKIKGAPITIVMLFTLSCFGMLIGSVVIIGLIAMLVTRILGQSSWSWPYAFYFVLCGIGSLVLMRAAAELHQVMNAYALLDDLRAEVSAKDPELLTKAERGVLQFYRHGRYVP